MSKIELEIAAEHIPNGSTVRKVTGTKLHTLVRSLKIYGERGTSPRLITPEPVSDHVVFLLSQDPSQAGSLNQVSGSKKLVWVTTNEQISVKLDELLKLKDRYISDEIRCPQCGY